MSVALLRLKLLLYVKGVEVTEAELGLAVLNEEGVRRTLELLIQECRRKQAKYVLLVLFWVTAVFEIYSMGSTTTAVP